MQACDYEFDAPDRPPVKLRILLDRPPATSTVPWTQLDFHRCGNCPLSPAPGACCPAAADLEPVVEALGSVASIQSVKVTVTTPQRVYQQSVTGSEGARAALGLVMATSGCPILEDLRVLAHFHLPFATQQESTFRFVSAYLLRQFLAQQAPGNLDGLVDKMDELRKLNIAFANRLRAACSKDALPNAIVQLFTLSMAVGGEAEDGLEGLRRFFAKQTDNAADGRMAPSGG
ncbi:MAG: hypothetical protein FJ137_20260 [Deltaproteobacteria bacterium]|nr:hypothetical protein [Deltaproteobacteria bacterium]